MAIAAVGQFCGSSCASQNLKSIRILIEKAVKCGASALFLPEASDYIAGKASDHEKLVESIDKSTVVLGVQNSILELKKNKNIELHVSMGIHEPSEETIKNKETGGIKKLVKNTLIWITPNGEIRHKYEKLHLFDVDIKKRGVTLKESESVEAGNKSQAPIPFNSPLGKIGSGICYDIRFPEHALRLRRLGAEILLYPSAFTVRTGAAHWETLGRARAIDTQCYVIMAAQVGTHKDTTTKTTTNTTTNTKPNLGRASWGHAMIVDPWGSIIAQCSDINDEPNICIADIDLDLIEKVRESMPLWEQRRKDVYGIV